MVFIALSKNTNVRVVLVMKRMPSSNTIANCCGRTAQMSLENQYIKIHSNSELKASQKFPRILPLRLVQVWHGQSC